MAEGAYSPNTLRAQKADGRSSRGSASRTTRLSVDKVSGYSTRVGATQDLAAPDIDLAAITQAGGWKSTRMPLQYAKKINAARSAMARAAAACQRRLETAQLGVRTNSWIGLGCISEVRAVLHGTA